MAVTNQIWFIDIPLVAADPRNLAEIVIGFPFPATPLIEDYLRKYLNDANIENFPLVETTGIDLDVEVDGPDNIYLRRYLNDSDKVASTGVEVNLDSEVDSEYNNYLRRYLNDRTD